MSHPPLYAVLSKVWLAGLSSREMASSSSSSSSSSLPSSVQKGVGGGDFAGRSSGGYSSLSSSSSTERLYLVYSWFYFEAMAKSMGLERCERGSLIPQYRDEFLTHFQALMDLFVVLVCKHRSIGLMVVRQLVTNLAAFLLDLFALIEKDSVIELIERFVVPLRSVGYDPVLLELKFVFHTILCDYSLYWDVAELHELDLAAVQLRAKERVEERMTGENGVEFSSTTGSTNGEGGDEPLEGQAAGGGSEYRELVREELLQQLRSDYRLCALLIDDFVHHFQTKEALLRDQVIDCLRLFLTKTDYDQRWRSAKPLIAQALFPLIPALCEEVEVIVALEPRARRNVLLPFMWILHLLPPSILHCLWQCEDAEDQVGLLTLLTLSLNDFAYAGIKARESDQSSEPHYTLASESIDHLINQSMTGGKGGGDGGGGGGGTVGGLASSNPAAMKRDLERLTDLMYSAHKQKSFNRGRITTVGAAGTVRGGSGRIDWHWRWHSVGRS